MFPDPDPLRSSSPAAEGDNEVIRDAANVVSRNLDSYNPSTYSDTTPNTHFALTLNLYLILTLARPLLVIINPKLTMALPNQSPGSVATLAQGL